MTNPKLKPHGGNRPRRSSPPDSLGCLSISIQSVQFSGSSLSMMLQGAEAMLPPPHVSLSSQTRLSLLHSELQLHVSA